MDTRNASIHASILGIQKHPLLLALRSPPFLGLSSFLFYLHLRCQLKLINYVWTKPLGNQQAWIMFLKFTHPIVHNCLEHVWKLQQSVIQMHCGLRIVRCKKPSQLRCPWYMIIPFRERFIWLTIFVKALHLVTCSCILSLLIVIDDYIWLPFLSWSWDAIENSRLSQHFP